MRSSERLWAGPPHLTASISKISHASQRRCCHDTSSTTTSPPSSASSTCTASRRSAIPRETTSTWMNISSKATHHSLLIYTAKCEMIGMMKLSFTLSSKPLTILVQAGRFRNYVLSRKILRICVNVFFSKIRSSLNKTRRLWRRWRRNRVKRKGDFSSFYFICSPRRTLEQSMAQKCLS